MSLANFPKQRQTSRPSLAITHPDLTRQWHPTKNGQLKSSDITHASKQKVWWICDKGHEWKATPSNRVKGSGCPDCAGRIASAKNNLAIKEPSLASQWHPTKNGNLTPFDVLPGNQKKVWWLCEYGHEWEDSPYNRRGSKNCPYCLNKKVSPTNSLSVQYPELTKEWHPTKNGSLSPALVVSGSGRTVWWVCENGHEWKARIVDRANGRGCAKCMGKQAHVQHNLALKFPELLKEWHPSRNGELTPYLVTPRSNKKVWWQCSRGHEWESTISNRTKGQKCPECKPNTSLQEIRLFCELKAIFKQVSWRNRVHGVECDVFIVKYSAAVEYDGAFWHERRTTEDQLKNHKLATMGIQLFRVRSHGLKKLSQNDIVLSPKQTINPDINVVKILLRTMKQTLPLDEPDKKMVLDYLSREDFVNSKEFKQITSCLPGPPIEKSLAAQVPELAKQWHFAKNAPLTPQMFHAGSGKKVWWICDNGHEWRASILNRTRGSGCPFCAGQRALPENNFGIRFPELVKQWHPIKNVNLSPYELTPKSHIKIWWLCESGHEWQSSVNGRARGSGCPYCTGKKVSADRNLASKFQELVVQWHPKRNGDLKPEMISPGSDRKVWWLCEKGHEWESAVSSRTTGVGCPYCAAKLATRDHNLAVKFPEIAREWHPLKNGDFLPVNALPHSGKKAWWICDKGHEWKASIAGRTGGSGCPDCQGTRVTTLNNLAVKLPDIAKLWHPEKNGTLTPDRVKAGSDKKVWWVCEKGHEWLRRIQHQVKSKNCPVCKRLSQVKSQTS